MAARLPGPSPPQPLVVPQDTPPGKPPEGLPVVPPAPVLVDLTTPALLPLPRMLLVGGAGRPSLHVTP